jgi:hypothetical protein
MVMLETARVVGRKSAYVSHALRTYTPTDASSLALDDALYDLLDMITTGSDCAL